MKRKRAAALEQSGAAERLCPSAEASEGAILVGMFGPSARLAYITPATRVDGAFLAAAREHEGSLGSVRGVLQKPAEAGGHGMLVMFDITDPAKVARHDHQGCYARDC
jgi:hypothetical protein